MKKKKGLIVDIIERERFGLEYVVCSTARSDRERRIELAGY
jgi:hypothetical protein